VDKFQLTTNDEDDTATGMMIYNTNGGITGGHGTGIYVWNGSRWDFIGLSGGVAIPVVSITVSGLNILPTGVTATYTCEILPSNATNSTVKWSVINEGGSGEINQEGVFIAGSPGYVKIRVTSTDGSGVYGEKQVEINNPVTQVTNVTISCPGNNILAAGDSILLVANVMPENASNKTLQWIISNHDGTARNTKIREDGNNSCWVIGKGNGSVAIKATSESNTALSDVCTMIIKQSSKPGDIIKGSGDNTYRTYCYTDNLGCWMIDNSQEGIPTYVTYSGTLSGRGYYYSWMYASSACPQGYALPTKEQFEALADLILHYASDEEKNHWILENSLAGLISNGTGLDWGKYGNWWIDGPEYKGFAIHMAGYELNFKEDGFQANDKISVRCIKN
jgi:hypothetical protein